MFLGKKILEPWKSQDLERGPLDLFCTCTTAGPGWGWGGGGPGGSAQRGDKDPDNRVRMFKRESWA